MADGADARQRGHRNRGGQGRAWVCARVQRARAGGQGGGGGGGIGKDRQALMPQSLELLADVLSLHHFHFPPLRAPPRSTRGGAPCGQGVRLAACAVTGGRCARVVYGLRWVCVGLGAMIARSKMLKKLETVKKNTDLPL